MSDIDALRERDSIDERVIEEIEALQAILLDEIIIKTDESPCPGVQPFPVVVESVVLPSTAADVDLQYVRVSVCLGLPAAYPDESPYVVLRNPRGLADEVLSRIEDDVKLKCADFCGQPVIYEIIELVKEHLTSSNCPSCVCAVCLFGFQQGDAFSKTECFHYFHSHCLACYVRTTQHNLQEEQAKLPLWQQKQLLKDGLSVQKMRPDDKESESFQVPCPVCREPIGADLESLSTAAPPIASEAAPPFEVTKELRALQHQMSSLYLHQKNRGGIIDLNADQNKLLLLTSGSSESAVNSSLSMDAARSSRPLRAQPSRGVGGSRSIRGSTWSSSNHQQECSWNMRSRHRGLAEAGPQGGNAVPVQHEFDVATNQEAIEHHLPHDNDSNDDSEDCVKGGGGRRNGGRGGGGRGRGGGRWSYHRSRGGRRSSRGRLRVACNPSPSS